MSMGAGQAHVMTSNTRIKTADVLPVPTPRQSRLSTTDLSLSVFAQCPLSLLDLAVMLSARAVDA